MPLLDFRDNQPLYHQDSQAFKGIRQVYNQKSKVVAPDLLTSLGIGDEIPVKVRLAAFVVAVVFAHRDTADRWAAAGGVAVLGGPQAIDRPSASPAASSPRQGRVDVKMEILGGEPMQGLAKCHLAVP